MNPTERERLETMLKSYRYSQPTPDFSIFLDKFNINNNEEVDMSEKKGGFKIFIWLFSFMVIVALGWFGLTKLTLINQQNKLEKGEAIIATIVVGDVSMMNANSTLWQPLFAGQTMERGDSLKTGIDSSCELHMVNKGVFRIGSSTKLLVASLVNDEGKIKTSMKLSKGEIAVKPKKLDKDEVFQVETESAVAAVRGTTFSVNVDDEGNTKISVTEGKVAVKPNIKSLKEAESKGQVSKEAAESLNKILVQPLEIEPGQELSMDKKKVEAMDMAIGNAIEKVAAAEGPITVEKVEMPKVYQEILAKAEKEVIEELELKVIPKQSVVEGKAVKNITATVFGKEEISEKAKEKLDRMGDKEYIVDVADIKKLKITSKPAGAEVYLNNEYIGNTPAYAIVSTKDEAEIRILKNGYEPYTASIDTKVQDSLSVELAKQTAELDQAIESQPSKENQVVEGTEALVKPDEIGKPDETVIQDKNETGIQSQTPKIVHGEVQWNTPKDIGLNVSDFNEPVFYDGKIFATYMNKLYILNTDGKVEKTINVVGSGELLTKPVLIGGKILVSAYKGGVYAYNSSGNLVWKAASGSQQFEQSTPSGRDGIIAVPSINQGIKLYDYNGNSKGAINTTALILASPLVLKGGKFLVYGTGAGEVVGYDIESQTEVWKKSFDGLSRVLYQPVGNNSSVAVVEQKTGLIICFDPMTGQQKWDLTIGSYAGSKIAPKFTGNYIVLVSRDRTKLYMVNINSGKISLKKEFANGITGVPFLMKNELYVGSANGKVHAYSIDSKKELWSSVVSDNKVSIVVADDNSVYSISKNKMQKMKK